MTFLLKHISYCKEVPSNYHHPISNTDSTGCKEKIKLSLNLKLDLDGPFSLFQHRDWYQY